MAKYIIGLTGGIGSGKTTVSEQFKLLGIDVIDADVIAHQVTELGQPALDEIIQHFGSEAALPCGNLNRAWLRQRVFSDAAAKQWLEELLHPLIGTAILSALDASETIYTVFVSPLLLTSALKDLCQHIVVVDIPQTTQLERTQQRDRSSRETIQAIITQQMSREERLEHADDVIDNSRDLAHLTAQIGQLHDKFLVLAKQQ